ncbi:MAG: substrate-binding domain-containing protein [Verrucomicrobia bacterium]|nr:substrate-binding domain-containing protein [Verrucomicrobiota bacterium]
MLRSIVRLTAALLLVGAALPASAQPAPYAKTMGLQGVLRIVGSDGHQDLGRLWAEKFRTVYPSVIVQVEGGGSQAAVVAIKEGRADCGLMARALNAEEKELLGERLNRTAAVHVATDVLAFFVAKENTTPGLTLGQLERLYGNAPRNGGALKTWADLGAANLGPKPVVLLGRAAGTGVHSLVKALVLGGGAVRSDVREMVGPTSVIQSVAADPTAIGYAQLRHRSNRVRALAVGAEADKLVEPTLASAQAGSYPLVHDLFLVIEASPDANTNALRTEFVRFVLSREGQEVLQSSVVPVRPTALAAELGKLK